MRKTGGERIQALAGMIFSKADLESLELTQKQLTTSTTRSQKEIEGWYFGIRKHLFDYDSVVDKQRKRIYKLRDSILESEDDEEMQLAYVDQFKQDFLAEANAILITQIDNAAMLEQPISDLLVVLNKEFGLYLSQADAHQYAQLDYETLKAVLIERLDQYFTKAFDVLPTKILFDVFRGVHLHFIDKLWVDHIDDMQNLREKVGLMSYAQLDPLVIYKKESFEKFQALLTGIMNATAAYLMKLDFELLNQQQQGSLTITTDGQQENKVIDILTSAHETFAHAPNTPAPQSSYQDKAHIFESNEEFEVFETGDTPIVTQKQDGKIRPNDTCPCGSGKKYKKCHGK